MLNVECSSAAFERLQVILSAREMRALGMDWESIGRQLGRSHITVWKWCDQVKHIDCLSPADCLPKRRTAVAAPPTLADAALLNEDFCRELESLYASTIRAASDYTSGGRRSGSVTLALRRISEEAVCPAALAEMLRAGKQPKELVAHLRARFTPEVEARIRGEKHFQLHGFVSRRDHTVRLPDGRRCELLAGFLVEFDDMSSNQPFYTPLPDGGWLVSRQGLYARDVRRRRWLGLELVARPREAYRAEDILRFFRRLMLDYGKFDVLRLEQGIWAARAIRGYRITSAGDVIEEEFERPAMDAQESTQLQAGLAAIGLHLQYARSAHQKVIESGFNGLQPIIATYTREFINLGAHAGEIEFGAKRLRQARDGMNPAALGFAPMEVLADRIWQAMAYDNARPRTGGITPDEGWAEDIARRELPALNERDLAAFLPEVRERSVDHGRVVVMVDGRPHDFSSDAFAPLGHGFRVYCRFDPTEPTLGAAIYNRETSSANHQGWKDGDFICFARWEMPGPQIDLAEARGLVPQSTQEIYGVDALEDDGLTRRKALEKWARTTYRALPRPGKPPTKRAELRTGSGDVTKIESGAPVPQPAASKPRRTGLEAPSQAQFARRAKRFSALASAYESVEGTEARP